MNYKQLMIAGAPALLLFAFNETTWIQNAYNTYPRMDIPMHILGGVCIAWMTVSLAQLHRASWKGMPVLMRFTLIIGAAAFAGIAWEWYEYIHDLIYQSHFQLSNADTMKDLLDDMIGGTLGALLFSRYDKITK